MLGVGRSAHPRRGRVCVVGRYIVRRILISIPTVLGITVVVFLLSNMIPGDPIDYMIPPEGGIAPETLERLRQAYELDRPLPVRYAAWLKQALTGNLGYRFKTHEPVLWAIANRFPPTLLLVGTSLVIGTVVGIPLGMMAAVRQYSLLDQLMSVIAFLGVSLPAFFAGLLAIYFFSVKWPLFPSGGWQPTGAVGFHFLDLVRHLVLPATVLALIHIATILRYTRSSLLEVLEKEYVMTARAKGLAERYVIVRHALKNALLPIITVIGLIMPTVIGGAVFTESIFSWPGMGTLFVDAVVSRDYPLIMGMTLIIAIAVLLINLAVDIAYGFVNPRIRYE